MASLRRSLHVLVALKVLILALILGLFADGSLGRTAGANAPKPAPSASPSVTPRGRAAPARAVRARPVPAPRKPRVRFGRHGFVWPVHRDVITSGFGPRWDGELHRGADINCAKRYAIVAAQAGTVVFRKRMTIYGRILVIRHGKGFSTLYAHMRRMYVNTGDRVRRGQRIGLCGNSGRSTGRHLHFEIRRNGRWYDPMKFLPR